jgi:biotin synthase-related radical SAM superfamily protein
MNIACIAYAGATWRYALLASHQPATNTRAKKRLHITQGHSSHEIVYENVADNETISTGWRGSSMLHKEHCRIKIECAHTQRCVRTVPLVPSLTSYRKANETYVQLAVTVHEATHVCPKCCLFFRCKEQANELL